MSVNHFDALEKTPANYVPLTPLSFLTRTADLHPSRTAVIYGERHYNWADVEERTTRLASALANAGIGPGDTVSIMCPNTPEIFCLLYTSPSPRDRTRSRMPSSA